MGAIGWIAVNSDTESEEFVIAAYVACAIIVLFAFLGIFAAIRESVCLTATVGFNCAAVAFIASNYCTIFSL